MAACRDGSTAERTFAMSLEVAVDRKPVSTLSNKGLTSWPSSLSESHLSLHRLFSSWNRHGPP